MQHFVFSSTLAASLVAVGCGGQTFDVGAPGQDGGVDSSSDGISSDTRPGDDTRPVDDSALDVGPDSLPVDWTACLDVRDCQLAPATCCGTCGTWTASDIVALAKVHASDYRSAVCGPTPPGCPKCAGRPDPSLQTTCSTGHCAVLDVRTSDVSACTTDTDCVIRAPECCEPCGLVDAFDLIALNRSQVSSYLTKVCGGDVACPDCVSTYPPGISARCDTTSGHCVVVRPI